jgi:hypothetical protein
MSQSKKSSSNVAMTTNLLSKVEQMHRRAQERLEAEKPIQSMLDFDEVDEFNDAANGKRERLKLLPVRHVERDFFLCDMFDYAMKDDRASMEAPIFTLSTKPDLSIWHWENKDSSRSVKVYTSVKGRATQFDKNVLIFVVSQMTKAPNGVLAADRWNSSISKR